MITLLESIHYFSGNIETLMVSLELLTSAVINDYQNPHFWTNVAESKWLNFLSQILSISALLSTIVDEYNDSILIYCASGTDYTPLLISTTMLLLDP